MAWDPAGVGGRICGDLAGWPPVQGGRGGRGREVDAETVFEPWIRSGGPANGPQAETLAEYHEEGDLIWARYTGGAVRLGHLVGVRRGDALEFRYTQLNTAGESSSGHCVSTLEILPDGRLRLHESWRWESREGAGTSTVDEIAP
jgi:hypothetical protein